MTQDPQIFGTPPIEQTQRPVKAAMIAGAKNRCPKCGKGRIFSKFTTVNAHCPTCGLHLAGHRADDAPPYFTMLIAGHITIPLILEMQHRMDPPLWQVFGFWSVVLGVLIWWLLPVTKGALIGLQWANKMHGFSDNPDEDLEASLRME